MRKIYISYIVTISIISLIYINNTSALDYSSNVGIGFTFNPTLSINISSSDLVISNLKPGTTEDSNSINVSVATNAAYGYTLSATVGDNTHDNSNLTHSNNTNVFSSIAIDADLENLTMDNTWGYNTSLDGGSTWSNYNGLSSSSNAILLDNSNAADSTGGIDFKIAAKAGNTQPSGEYTGTINFYATTKPTPITLSEAYTSEGKTMINSYYTMQDMTSTICDKTEAIGAQLQVLDIRDNKLYWISKLADNHCWMTQNLDLDLSHDRPLTSEDTDLNDNSLSGAYSENYKYDSTTRIIAWTPKNITRSYQGSSGTTWKSSSNVAYSLDPGEWYWDGDDDTPDCNYPDFNQSCTHFTQNVASVNMHLSVGNYYNWSAAIASDDSSSLGGSTYSDIVLNPQNSICPKGWRLPTVSNESYTVDNSTSEFGRLNHLYNGDGSTDSKLISSPLWFVRSGWVGGDGSLYNPGSVAFYWSSTIGNSNYVYSMYFTATRVRPADSYNGYLRYYGWSVRCLAR